MSDYIKPKDVDKLICKNKIPRRKLCGKIDCEPCYYNSFASNKYSKYLSPKNNISPYDICMASTKMYLFECDVCHHEFEYKIVNLQKRKTDICEYCDEHKVCDNDQCEFCEIHCFGSIEQAIYWNYKLNNNISPRNIPMFENKEYWFDCSTCNSSFQRTISFITIKERWCTSIHCSRTQLCDDLGCVICENKSFASNTKRVGSWSELNTLTPRQVFKSTADKYLFKCSVCKHTFPAGLNKVTCDDKWCPHCGNTKLCSDRDCQWCFEHSFISSPLAIYWDDPTDMRTVSRSSTTYKYAFKCKRGHKFSALLNNISKGKWCPMCFNKTEQELYDYLIILYPDLDHHKTFDWCKNPATNHHLVYDFYIPSLNIIIELDGAQHFTQISNWGSPEQTLIKDIYKMQKAIERNIIVIRILQDDVWNNLNDWKNKLKQHMFIHNTPEIVYLDNGTTIYDNHKQGMIQANTLVNLLQIDDPDYSDNGDVITNNLEDGITITKTPNISPELIHKIKPIIIKKST